MTMESDEIGRLRATLRDLVALSTIPAAWVGREPALIAAGLADVLMGWLRLDFAFVRLCDLVDGSTCDALRGSSDAMPHWLEERLDASGRCRRREVVLDIGGDTGRCSALVIPVGVDGAGGVVAVACDRAGFPTETDQLLVSVATNQAATAFESARVIHQRRQAEQQLRHARDELETKVAERTVELQRAGSELRAILDASPVGILLLGRDRAVQRCNAAFERLLGWTSEEIVGRRIPLPEEVEEHLAPLMARLDRGEGFSGIEMRMVRKDGTELDARLAGAPFVDEEGRTTGLVANVEDVTELKEVEHKLRRARRELARVGRRTTLAAMAASIAHEINQPLAAIIANASASLRRLAAAEPDLEDVRDALKSIVDDGHRASGVIGSVRALFGSGGQEGLQLDVNDLVGEVLALVRGELETNRILVRAELRADLPKIVGERVPLQQVMLNLIMNAVDSMSVLSCRARRLLVGTEPGAAGDVLIRVEDCGTGIEPENLERVFDPFFSTKPQGMGIGLTISRSIVEAHGGRLWATSVRQHGSTFHVQLPVWRGLAAGA